MGSKNLMKTLIAVFVVFLMIMAVTFALNWDILSRKFGFGNGQAAEAQSEDVLMADKQLGDNLSAFMQDETFFDTQPRYKSIESFAGRAVSMIMSSVAKDLRIMIVDSRGQLVTGVPFTVTVSELGEYTDDNEDGIIYLDKLRAGEYSVFLNERKGYIVPDTVTTIRVKQDIEYRVLDNVEYLMLTEKDVDASKEDTEVKEAQESADGTENMELGSSTEGARRGIDVSKFNKKIDWDAVKDDGVEFAIIRCGYRGSSSGSLIIDPTFEYNIKGAINAGIPVGVYFFTQAINEVEAVEEASMVINLIREYDVDYPVFLDSESAGGNGRADNLPSVERTRIHKAFLETIASAGYEAGIYASANWFRNRVDTAQLENYRIWLAEYADVPSYEGYYQMWQYTSKGRIDGISTNVDLDICYMRIDTTIDHSAGAGGYTGVVSGESGNVPR